MRTIASVAAWIEGSGTVSTRTSSRPCHVTARMRRQSPRGLGSNARKARGSGPSRVDAGTRDRWRARPLGLAVERSVVAAVADVAGSVVGASGAANLEAVVGAAGAADMAGAVVAAAGVA